MEGTSKQRAWLDGKKWYGLFIAISLIITSIGIAIPKIDNKTAAAGTINDFKFAAVGDFDCKANTISTLKAINKVQPEKVMALGDYSYRTAMTCWHDEMMTNAPTWVHDKLHNLTSVAIGNHENVTGCFNCPANSHLDSAGRAAFDQHFGFNATHPTYYSFDQKGVHFLVLDAMIRNETGSPQYNFVIDDLTKASKNQSINWIVVNFHQPMYSSGTNPPTCINFNETRFRSTYQPLFDRNRVDLVLQGHVHDYERLKPLSFNNTITSTNSSTYNDPRGQIFVTVGTGGVTPVTWCTVAPMSAAHWQDDGFLLVNITNNAKTLDGRFIDKSNITRDTFTITHNGKYTYAPFWTFNGANYEQQDYTSSMNLSSFSVATWFQTNEDYSNYTKKSIIANRGGFGSESAGQNMNYGIWIQCGKVDPNLDSCALAEAGKIQAGFEASDGANWFVTSQNKYNDGRWHYAVVTFDNSGTQHPLTLYIDGKLDNSVTYSSSPDRGGSQPFRIGVNSLNLDRYFKGNADEVRVWNKALIASEITNQYNSGTFDATGQIIYRSNSETYFDATGSTYYDEPNSDTNAALRLADFTAASWFKTTADYSSSSDPKLIINKQGFGSETPGKNMNYGIWDTYGPNPNKIEAGFEASDGTDVYIRSAQTYNDGKWHHALVTFNDTSNKLTLYVDGLQVNSTATTLTPDSGSPGNYKTFRVGANSFTANHHFTGQVDHIFVWNRAFSPVEVSNLYNLNSAPQNGLVLNRTMFS